MSDIVERLRQPASHNDAQRQRKEAADEIERLRTRMREIVVLPDHYHISVANEIARAALEGK